MKSWNPISTTTSYCFWYCVFVVWIFTHLHAHALYMHCQALFWVSLDKKNTTDKYQKWFSLHPEHSCRDCWNRPLLGQYYKLLGGGDNLQWIYCTGNCNTPRVRGVLLKGPSQPHLCFCLYVRVWLLYFIPSMSKQKIIKHALRNTTYSKTIKFCFTMQYMHLNNVDGMKNGGGWLGTFN